MTTLMKTSIMYLEGMIEDNVIEDFIRLQPKELYTLSNSGTTFFYRIFKHACEIDQRERALDFLKILIRCGVNLNFQDIRRETLLMMFIDYEWIDAVKILLDANIDIYLTNIQKRNALQYCATSMRVDSYKKIIIHNLILERYVADITKKVRQETIEYIVGMMCITHHNIPNELKCEIFEKI